MPVCWNDSVVIVMPSLSLKSMQDLLPSLSLTKKSPLNPLSVNHPDAVESQVSDTFCSNSWGYSWIMLISYTCNKCQFEAG